MLGIYSHIVWCIALNWSFEVRINYLIMFIFLEWFRVYLPHYKAERLVWKEAWKQSVSLTFPLFPSSSNKPVRASLSAQSPGFATRTTKSVCESAAVTMPTVCVPCFCCCCHCVIGKIWAPELSWSFFGTWHQICRGLWGLSFEDTVSSFRRKSWGLVPNQSIM